MSFVGEIRAVPKEEAAAAREVYLQKHPGHFWVRAWAWHGMAWRWMVGAYVHINICVCTDDASHGVAAPRRTTRQVDFGDFDFFRLVELKAVRYNGGFARFGALEPEGAYNTRALPVLSATILPPNNNAAFSLPPFPFICTEQTTWPPSLTPARRTRRR